jgi:predicted DNA-binding protein with PD1-like motif
MKYSQARYGRVFVIRLEDGDILHEEIEHLAYEESIRAAALIVVGGADEGSLLVVGPENGQRSPVTPIEVMLDNVYEIAGTGTLFPDKEGKPVLHMHIAAGRENETLTGCVRQGVKVWRVMEVILFELLDSQAMRVPDPATGFELLQP